VLIRELLDDAARVRLKLHFHRYNDKEQNPQADLTHAIICREVERRFYQGGFMRVYLAAVGVQFLAAIDPSSIWAPTLPPLRPAKTTTADGHMSLGMRR
jgi:hypothetical protein